MKADFWRRFRETPTLKWGDAFILLGAIAAWGGAFYSRPFVLDTHCATNPASCTRESVNALDRIAVGWESATADRWSFHTQHIAGYLAFGAPALWSTALAIGGRLTPAGALAAVGTDLVIFGQTAFVNGMLMESARLTIQRPRPFVMENPGAHGASYGNYTSFYSGHTSFAALASTSMVLALAGRGAPMYLLHGTSIVAFLLTFLTGYFRVYAGRHYPTDVIFGALAGFLIAVFVARLHRNNAPHLQK